MTLSFIKFQLPRIVVLSISNLECRLTQWKWCDYTLLCVYDVVDVTINVTVTVTVTYLQWRLWQRLSQRLSHMESARFPHEYTHRLGNDPRKTATKTSSIPRLVPNMKMPQVIVWLFTYWSMWHNSKGRQDCNKPKFQSHGSTQEQFASKSARRITFDELPSKTLEIKECHLTPLMRTSLLQFYNQILFLICNLHVGFQSTPSQLWNIYSSTH